MGYGRLDCAVNNAAAYSGAFHSRPISPNKNSMKPWRIPRRGRKPWENFKSMVALGRIGKPDGAAQAIVWLCSDAASYVTGHAVIVDGGLSARFR
jgi:NAD(P)-dependent dehydrogenase (short-subunit alcohol dehydrogenase family)